MQWIAMSGNWRAEAGTQAEKDVRAKVREIVEAGDGIVSGGALGIDYFALDEALKLDKEAKQIKIFLPSTLEAYAEHYRNRAKEGVITNQQAEALVKQLERLKSTNPGALIEKPKNRKIGLEEYYERNSEIVNYCDKLIAFRTQDSEGTQDAINKARNKNIPVQEFKYY